MRNGGGVYPFCGRCTASSEPWRAADPADPMGSRFYGHHDLCQNCGSSVRTLYSTVLWIPVAKVGRFRIIPTGGRSFVGRKVIDQPVEAVVRREPAPADHSELDGRPAYRHAEAYRNEREPGQALSFYHEALAEREKLLAVDDPATLRVRLRVAQGLMVGGLWSEAQLLADIVAVDAQGFDRHDPQLLRDRAALGQAPLACGEITEALDALTRTVADAAPGHPDTAVYRTALVEACEVAEARGKKRDLLAAAGARRLLNGEDVPTDR
jgi:hypothetical protein